MDRLFAEFEKFQSKLRQAETQFSGVEGMQHELTALESRATSPDRTVTVVAGPGGSIKDIALTADALRKQPDEVSATIMATLQQAVAEAAREQASIVDAHLGDTAPGGASVRDRVLEAQAEAMGTTVEDLESKLPNGGATTAPTSDDEHFDQDSVLRRGDEPSQAAPPPGGGSSAGDQFLANLFDDDEEDRR